MRIGVTSVRVRDRVRVRGLVLGAPGPLVVGTGPQGQSIQKVFTI
jgi:hypothetical protein